MHYCKAILTEADPEKVEQLLSQFTREQFAFGQVAYLLDDKTYSVDAGENDLRAVYDKEIGAIKFICRYKKDASRYERKISAFANMHDIETKSISS